MTQKTRRGRNIQPLRSDEKCLAVEQFPSYPLLSQHIVSVFVSSCVRRTNTPFQDCLFIFPLNQGLQPVCVPVLRPSGRGVFPDALFSASWYLVSYLMPANGRSQCLWQPLKAAHGTKKNLIKILFYWWQDILVSAESWVLPVLSEERCFPVGESLRMLRRSIFLGKCDIKHQ